MVYDKSDDALDRLVTFLIVGVGIFYSQQAVLDIIGLGELIKHLDRTMDMSLDQGSILRSYLSGRISPKQRALNQDIDGRFNIDNYIR
jgi:hypothetical protein